MSAKKQSARAASWRSIPNGASFGRDLNPRAPSLVSYNEILTSGSRAQRRWAERVLRRSAGRGAP